MTYLICPQTLLLGSSHLVGIEPGAWRSLYAWGGACEAQARTAGPARPPLDRLIEPGLSSLIDVGPATSNLQDTPVYSAPKAEVAV